MTHVDFGTHFPSGQLIDKDGGCELQPENYEYIGLYFSAHWCPPCRGFTPDLKKLYETKSDEDGKKLQIVFISSDRDETSFSEYFGEMPWIALKYNDRDGKAKLSSLFEVTGIPTLVILDKNGDLVTKDGRSGASGCNSAGDFVKWCRKQKK
ncbi:nucleoredoxin-like [Ruditapes philippinarum]|uniref:nucleoredoxin-like n=1 Tax=Ruditapes philippinarum TaxID=129788 RepID=UPI00295B853C|nr:nucleoredoxin-like [Ruditapes philippinarum]